MSVLDVPTRHDALAHLVEYPAGSGRQYHRHEDGSVLRLEARLAGVWHDLTCDTVEVSIQWGDTSGDDLTPYSDAGQARIVLKDVDGRYGPLPPSGFPLFSRWCPVRVWTGFVADPDDMPVDTTTRYGTPGTFGGTPPELYGGTARTVHADGIACRFSGWLMAVERTPHADPVTTWTCGDGMVRLVDQTVRDYDASTPPGTPVTDADWPPGLRENAAGNHRVSELVGFIHGPTGAPYGVVSHAGPTHRMMQSPGGTVGDLVHRVAEADLAFFWWQPDVSPADHDTAADWFGYRTFDWLSSHGLEWPIACDGVHGYDGTLTSDDHNFFSAVRAAKGMTTRTVWRAQPPWSGFAFDSSVAKLIGGASFVVEPGERYTFRSQLDLNCDKASVEYWFRITGPDLVKLGENTIARATNGVATVVSGSSSTIEVAADVPSGTVLEVQVRGRSLSPILAPGHLADNVWLIVTRTAGTGPVVLVDDATLADEAEVHEYERKDLILRDQDDVEAWAAWIVNRSSTARWSMENISANPDQGNELWSWGMWHSAWLGDRVNLEIPDGGELHEETQWIRGIEFRIAETLTMTLHLETVPAGMGRALRSTVTGEATGPSIPVDGGRIIPDYASPPELPGWSTNEAGTGLVVSSTGELVWGANDADIWPIRTAPVPGVRVELNKSYPREIRFYGEGGSTAPFGPYRTEFADPAPSGRIYADNDAIQIESPKFDLGGGYTAAADVNVGPFYVSWMENVVHTADDDPVYPSAHFDGYLEEGAQFGPPAGWFLGQGFGPGGRAYCEAGWEGAGTVGGDERCHARLGASTVDGDTGTELRATLDTVIVGTGPDFFDSLGGVGGAGNGTGILTPRGSVQALASSSGADPLTALYQRQIGSTAVTFTAGVGTVTVPVEMGVTRVPHAVVVGATVGGPAVAEIASTTTTLTVYLNTTHTGTLTVAWTVDHDAVTLTALERDRRTAYAGRP